jgi:hypothetical protein
MYIVALFDVVVGRKSRLNPLEVKEAWAINEFVDHPRRERVREVL